MKIYNDLDLQGNRLLNVANMPQFLLDIKLLHAKDIGEQDEQIPTYSDQSGWTDIDEFAEVTPVGTENPKEEGWYTRSGEAGSYAYTKTTDEVVVSGTTYYLRQWDEKYAALCYAYRTTVGIAVAAVSVADFLQEAEFKDGLQVSGNGEVSVLIDPTSAKDSHNNDLLTVSASGLKFSGSTLTDEQLAALAWAIQKREEDLQAEANALYSVTTSVSGSTGTSVISSGVSYPCDTYDSVTMTVTVTVKFNNVAVVPTNAAAVVEAGWTAVVGQTGVYTKSVTGGSGSVAAQAFTYTIPLSDTTYGGLTVSKNSGARSISAIYPIYYGFATTDDDDKIANVMAITGDNALTRSTTSYSFGGGAVTCNLTNDAWPEGTPAESKTAWYWILTHSSSGATMEDKFIGNMITLKTSSAGFVSPQNASISMSGYKLYISDKNALQGGELSSSVSGTINV